MSWLDNGFHFDLILLAVLVVVVPAALIAVRVWELRVRQQIRLERAARRRKADSAAELAYRAGLRGERHLTAYGFRGGP